MKAYNYHVREMRAYFLASSKGNYTFTLTGSVVAELLVTETRYSTENILRILLEKGKLSSSERRQSGSVILEACHFYFVKLITTYSYHPDQLSFGIEQEGGVYQNPIDSKRLFWALPGQRDIKLYMSKKHTTSRVEITRPINITGMYSIECLGLYCGDCPLAIFLLFAGQIKCVETSSLSVPQNGSVFLYFENLFMLPGEKPVYMGYKINGVCQRISKIVESNFSFADVVSKIGNIRLKPMILASCQFKQSRLCEEKGVVSIHGWRQGVGTTDKMHTLSTTENMTSSLTYEWIKYTNIVQRTGICLTFQYKMNGNNNTLAMYLKTSSGNKILMWRLRGNHGHKWMRGEVTYWPREDISFIFEGKITHKNTEVSLANIYVKTESCNRDIHPLWADPGYKCALDKFECENGECINSGFVCDGDKKCADGSDEIFCECLAEQFKCKSSEQCIDVRQMCNGLKDCVDGSDEKDCYKTCEPGKFYCPSGLCIPWSMTCNGVRDCPDGADEPLVCNNETKASKSCNLNDLGCSKQSRNITSCQEFVDGNCDFEKDGLCGWQQIQNGEDDFDWSINSGETSSKGTGPKVDHTTGTKEE